ncbi:MAG: hypothetical protein VX768_00955 [Planctomycetota bacterium]|nr:hypothetical protein [Planctomycetota bacterium]
MGFLNQFFDDVFSQDTVPPKKSSSFEKISDEELRIHLNIAKYDDFELTDAIRPAYDIRIKPQQAYRYDCYVDEENGTNIPVIMAAATKNELFEIFLDLIRPLGETVDVVLETSHKNQNGHQDLYRESIDMPVLKSILYEFEDLLVNDGCTGIAVINPRIPQEVQFDEHKLLMIYGSPLESFEHTLEQRQVIFNPRVKFLTEAEHIHSSTETFQEQFEALKTALGMDNEPESEKRKFGGEFGDDDITFC